MKIIAREDAYLLELFHQNNYSAARDFLIGRKSYYQDAARQLKCPYYCYLAKCHSMLGDYAKADDCFNMALNTIPHNFNTWLEMADSYMQRGKLRDAERVLIEINQRRSTEGTGYQKRLTQLMGRFFKLSGEYESCKICYEEYLKDRPDSVQAQKDLEFALQMLAQEKAYGPDPISGTMEYAAHLHWASKRMGLESVDLGVIFLKNRVQDLKSVDSKNRCYWALTQYALEAGRLDQATYFNMAAYQLDNNNAKTLATRVRLLISTGNEEAARDHFGRDFLTITDDLKATSGLGSSFLRAEMYDLAARVYDHLATAPNIPHSTRANAAQTLSSMQMARVLE